MNRQPSYIIPEPSILQEIVWDLEDYKRRLGRYFDKADTHKLKVWYFNRYNEVENTICKMCHDWNVTRKTKPYKLSLEALK